jgi:hypothetical protein
MLAVFGPIPLIDKSSSFIWGTFPLNFSNCVTFYGRPRQNCIKSNTVRGLFIILIQILFGG